MLVGTELVTNGNFSAWTGDNPNSWTVTGEVTTDPEVSQVGTGEGHGGTGTGMCNIYTSDGTAISIYQIITGLVSGQKYQISIKVNTVTAGSIRVTSSMWTQRNLSVAGFYTWTFISTGTQVGITIARLSGVTDVTIDDFSVKRDIPTELSRTGQRFSSHQEI